MIKNTIILIFCFGITLVPLNGMGVQGKKANLSESFAAIKFQAVANEFKAFFDLPAISVSTSQPKIKEYKAKTITPIVPVPNDTGDSQPTKKPEMSESTPLDNNSDNHTNPLKPEKSSNPSPSPVPENSSNPNTPSPSPVPENSSNPNTPSPSPVPEKGSNPSPSPVYFKANGRNGIFFIGSNKKDQVDTKNQVDTLEKFIISLKCHSKDPVDTKNPVDTLAKFIIRLKCYSYEKTLIEKHLKDSGVRWFELDSQPTEDIKKMLQDPDYSKISLEYCIENAIEYLQHNTIINILSTLNQLLKQHEIPDKLSEVLKSNQEKKKEALKEYAKAFKEFKEAAEKYKNEAAEKYKNEAAKKCKKNNNAKIESIRFSNIINAFVLTYEPTKTLNDSKMDDNQHAQSSETKKNKKKKKKN